MGSTGFFVLISIASITPNICATSFVRRRRQRVQRDPEEPHRRLWTAYCLGALEAHRACRAAIINRWQWHNILHPNLYRGASAQPHVSAQPLARAPAHQTAHYIVCSSSNTRVLSVLLHGKRRAQGLNCSVLAEQHSMISVAVGELPVPSARLGSN